jgi:hypothetical protein
MIKQLLSILLFFMTACTVTAQSEASSKINTSADAWIKKYATQFTVYKDTVVTLDSTESAEVIFDFTKSVDYKLGVVLSGEVNATLQVERWRHRRRSVRCGRKRRARKYNSRVYVEHTRQLTTQH